MTDKTAASIESCCVMHKRSYLLNRSTDLHKICSKMFAFFNPFFTQVTIKVCGPVPLIKSYGINGIWW